MAPIVDGAEENFGPRVVFKRVNANQGDGPQIMQAYRIPGHPVTLVFDRDGNETARFIGPQPAEAVAGALNAVLAE